MIIEAILNLLVGVIKLAFSIIPDLPQLPSSALSVVDQVFGYISSGIGIASVFIDMNFVRVMIPLLIVVVNFDKVYDLIMFVLRKIPFLGVQ